MLRGLVLALLLANLLFFAWTRGWLDDIVGVPAHGDREPQRLARQVRPERVTLLGAEDSPASAPVSAASGSDTGAASNAVACLEAGPFAPADAVAAVATLQAAQPPIAPGTWADVRSEKPGSWMVYMGRYANREALEKKQEELRRVRGATFEEVTTPADLSMGLSLGRFDERAKADQALEALAVRGLRTARVVQVAAPTSSLVLRVDKPSAALATQLLAIRFEGAGSGSSRRFAPCGTN